MVVVFILVSGTVGAFLFWRWYMDEEQVTKRALRNARKHSIRDFPDSTQGKVVGRLAYHQEELVAPLSGRPCAYYCITVSEYRSHGNSGSYCEIINEEKGVDFVLRDGTGTALVMVAAASTALTRDHKTTSGTFDSPTPREESYLNAHGEQGKGWVFNKSIRYVEGILEAGEQVSVYGFGSKEPDPDADPTGYRDAPPMRLRISGSVDHPSLISDIPSTR